MTVAAIAGLTVGLAAGAAGHNSIVDKRGIANCQGDMERDYTGVHHESRFYVGKGTDQTRYYFNSSAWVQDSRVKLSTKCTTSANGRAVLARETLAGHWEQPIGRISIEIAANLE